VEVVYTHCCGLDIHKKRVVACLITPEQKEIRSFGMMTADLWALAEWLVGTECTRVAMEKRGQCQAQLRGLRRDGRIRPSHAPGVSGRRI
jgi:hypothetical protein